MDVCTDRRCYSSMARTPTEIKMKLCYPLITRRPSTSYSSRQAFSPSPRIHSATPRIAMAATPRSNVVSTAGFYDWSTEDVDVSMTNIYRKLAVNQKNRLNRGNRNWCADGIHVSPGRMFIRDKADLTKGEREIIAGIYKNRGDVNKDLSRNGGVTQVKSHTDAWLIGKQISKKGGPFEVEKCSIKIPDTLFSKSDSQRETHENGESSNYLCEKCKENCLHHKYEQEVKLRRTEKAGVTAPPSSPRNSPKTSRKQKATPRISPEGGVFVESGKTFIDPEEGSKKKKVFVDVFLPKFPMQTDLTTLSIQIDNNSSEKTDKRRDSASRKSIFDSVIEDEQPLSVERSHRIAQKTQISRMSQGKQDKSRKSTSLSSSRSNSSTGD